MHLAKKIVGTLVPLASLHSKRFPKYGMFETGELFLDWLSKTGQSAWQLLPLHETQLERGSKIRHVSSPYKGYGIGLDPAYLSDLAKKRRPNDRQLQMFQQENAHWLTDYALFCALRDRFETDDWTRWDKEIGERNPLVLEKAKREFGEQIKHYTQEQWQCHRAYSLLREHAKSKNILLFGDIPFYIGLKSPLVWVHQELFVLDEDGAMPVVSGLPNSRNSYFGRQIWGHPLYRFDNEKSMLNIEKLWKMRLDYLALSFDIVRFDYESGFYLYGAIDIVNEKNDTLLSGPGDKLFEPLIFYSRSIGLVPAVEGLGTKIHTLRRTIDRLAIPSSRVLRYAYNEKSKVIIRDYADVASYPRDTIAYTTTHDTETLVGHILHLSLDERKLLAKNIGIAYTDKIHVLSLRMREKVLGSNANIIIIPMQDWLLTNDRINTPGTEREKDDPNWQYRLAIPVEQLPMLKDT